MLQNQEIDVLAKSAGTAEISLDSLPSVDAMPTLPPMRNFMDVDLAVSAEGRVYILYDGKIPENTEYVVYSIDDASLNLVSYNGRQQDIGMTVHKPMRKYMRGADKIFIIEMKDSQPGRIIKIPMIIHDIGI